MRRLARPLLVLVALSLAAGCADDDDSTITAPDQTATTSAPSAGTPGTTITIKDFSFSPAHLRSDAGDEILVRNTDGVVHTLTAEDKSFDTGSIEGNAEKTLKMSGDGTFAYRCNIHQSMKGTITVS